MHRAGLTSLSQYVRNEAVISLQPEIDDLVPSEASLRHSVFDSAGASSFPKVLRRRLDDFFSDGNISPKADRTMWVKIAVGLAVLAGSWIALYTLKPGSWKFVGLYLLNAIAQTFLLLNIAHDSNHNAISSVRTVNKALNYVFDVCGISSYMWRILHHRGHHSCINLHGEDDALTGRRILRFTPHEPRMPIQRFQHIYALLLYALFSLDYVFLRDFECFFFPSHDYLKSTKHPMREYVTLFAGKAFYVTYMLVLPVVVLGKSPLLVALAFLLAHLIIGLSVALVFQTTHSVDSTYFPSDRSEFDNGIYHIFATTADYATTNPLVGWLAGGLNHHIVHHLCPFVCHTHYAPLTRIVKETAEEYGIPYRQHPTMNRAIKHHLLLLKQLGNQDQFSST
ncbi:Linoleoyl-CoA desaturase [Candidatus Sulfotelmatobacter kueseliae]|uniref:Linoleoyl-CoA desaturase n=1 Tax=Candidatus Sulfotelmatobacter kueseliae TaxID=2042962 RepID=A0A2U3KYM8_9BACT|nr:Linoleoyl-CoA desaturase [Candidatus Sulfotelmatobacter kueseliae]